MDTREFLDQLPDRNLAIRMQLRDVKGRMAVLVEEQARLEVELQLMSELRVFDQRRTEKLEKKTVARTTRTRGRSPGRPVAARFAASGGRLNLTKSQKQEIRDSPETARQVAKRYGVTPTTIWRVRRVTTGPVAVRKRA